MVGVNRRVRVQKVVSSNLTAPTTLRGFQGNQLRVAGLPTIALAAAGLFVVKHPAVRQLPDGASLRNPAKP